jgi:hypothetical protein
MLWRGKHDSGQHEFSSSQSNAAQTKSRKLKNNVPGTSLGPGELLGVKSCHGVLLMVQTRLGLDTGHRERGMGISSGQKKKQKISPWVEWGVGALRPDLQVPVVSKPWGSGSSGELSRSDNLCCVMMCRRRRSGRKWHVAG